MNKTIKEWLSELPEPYKTKALKYAALEKTEDKTVNTMHEAIMEAFTWGQTIQGKHYWLGLYNIYSY